MNLRVSELFYSIQGEGATAGRPAIFLRLAGCNLLCDGEWTCDTLEVWKKGIIYTIDALKKRIDNILNENDKHKNKSIHLVITGGEPLLKQEQLRELIKSFNNELFIEVETNGTIIPDLLSDMVDMFNVSPKLPSSGNEKSKFYNPEALDYFVQHTNMIFKFVISDKDDIEPIQDLYSNAIYRAGRHRTYLMPACETREEYNATAPMVAELCMETGFNFSNRLQINIYDKKTGV